MELLSIVITFFYFVILTPCLSLQIQVQASPKQDQLSIIVHRFPRKLRLAEEITVVKGQAHVSSTTDFNNNNKKKEKISTSGVDREQEEVALHGSSGEKRTVTGTKSSSSSRETEAEDEISNLFPMDYSCAKRRRPIHNKSLPVSP